MSNTITIKNCKVVNEGQITEKDLIIKNGRFEKIGNDLASEGETIDAAGLFLFPGIIDDQCHFREPGLTERGSIKTESLSAVAGGTTSFMDMPNVIPPTLSLDLWRDKISIAEKLLQQISHFIWGPQTLISMKSKQLILKKFVESKFSWDLQQAIFMLTVKML